VAKTEVAGLDKLLKKLKALPPAFEKAAKTALGEAAQDIVDTMKRLVPVDSGDLRDSIDWTFGSAPKGALVLKSASVQANGRKIAVTIFAGNAEAFYARWVEFGTKPHAAGGMFKGALNPGTTAHPFFYPAYRLKKKKAKARISRQLNQEAKRIAAQ
jgi:HK97 gp10 family phage protein